MAGPARKATRHPAVEEHQILAAGDEDGQNQVKRFDPAQVAMRLMLARALHESGMTVDDVGRDGLVIIILVISDAWTQIALEEWQTRIRHGEAFRNGFQERLYSSGCWSAWPAVDPSRSRSVGDAATEAFARAVMNGDHCAAFTPDLSWLPTDIGNCVDQHLRLPQLTGADVIAVSQQISDTTASGTFADDEAAAITPRLLRLARRREQDADAYLIKLRRLLDRELNVAVRSLRMRGNSPRESPSLHRLHGFDDGVAWGLGVAEDIQAYQRGEISWTDVNPACLVSGPPGCGKTLFARALAETCKLPLITGSFGDWHSSGNAHQGSLLKAMKRTFSDARASAPSILFIDEIDSFPNRSTITHHYADLEIQVVNALLAEIDGCEGREGVILIGACNHPEKLDPALLRSGRLDRHIRIHLPTRAALAGILREHLGGDLPDERLDGAALSLVGSTGADCERIVRGACGRARKAGRAMVISDLMAEIGGFDSRSDGNLWLAAIHESGHALAQCELYPGSLQAVSLRAIGDIGGGTFSQAPTSYLSASDVHKRLVVTLSGRAAEQEILGFVTSGAGGDATSDLAQATGLAATAAFALGLDETVGPIWRGVPEPANLADMLRHNPIIASQIRAVIDLAYSDARDLVGRRSTAVKALAAALRTRQVIDGAEAESIVASHPHLTPTTVES